MYACADKPHHGECRLCWHEALHPSSLRNTPDAKKLGRLVRGGTNICSEPSKAHMFHLQCVESFIMEHRKIESIIHSCPTCKEVDEDLGELTSVEDRLNLGGKARNREKSKYLCWVHVIQAAGLKLKGSDKAIKPVCNISCWGQSRNTDSAKSLGWHIAFDKSFMNHPNIYLYNSCVVYYVMCVMIEKSYTHVWDSAFSFQADLVTRITRITPRDDSHIHPLEIYIHHNQTKTLIRYRPLSLLTFLL